LVALAGAAVIAGAAGCGTPSTHSQTTSATTPTAKAPATATLSAYVTLDLTIDKRIVTPTNAALQAKVGQPIVVRVTTDEYDELRVGSSPDLRFGVDPRARAPQQFQFTIDVPGQVDVELFSQSGCPHMCTTSYRPDTTVATIDVQPSAATTMNPAPLATEPTRVPCDLLSPSIAQVFAGDDAQRQPTGETICSYRSSTRSVSLSVNPMPTNPDAPVNHFDVIRPENQLPGLPYQAYWFAAGNSLVVVKDDLLLFFTVTDNPIAPNAQINQDRKAEDIQLADLIVPRVG